MNELSRMNMYFLLCTKLAHTHSLQSNHIKSYENQFLIPRNSVILWSTQVLPLYLNEYIHNQYTHYWLSSFKPAGSSFCGGVLQVEVSPPGSGQRCRQLRRGTGSACVPLKPSLTSV